MKNLLALAALALLPSCMNQQRWADLQASQTQLDYKIDEALADQEATNLEKLAAIKDANAAHAQETLRIANEAKNATLGLISDAAKGPLGVASPVIEGIAGLLLAGFGAHKTTMRARDKQSETTYNKPPPPHAPLQP